MLHAMQCGAIMPYCGQFWCGLVNTLHGSTCCSVRNRDFLFLVDTRENDITDIELGFWGAKNMQIYKIQIAVLNYLPEDKCYLF